MSATLTKALVIEDESGDSLTVETYNGTEPDVVVTIEGVYLTKADADALYEFLHAEVPA